MYERVQKYCCLYECFQKLDVDASPQEFMDLIKPCIEKEQTFQDVPRAFIIRETVSWFMTAAQNYTKTACVTSEEEQPTHLCDLPTEPPFKAYVALWSILLVLIVCGNILVISTMLRVRYLRKNVANLFIVSLAVSDFCIGVFIIPIKMGFAKHNMTFCFNGFVCRLYVIADTTFFVTSIVNLVVIAFDRYFALTYPSRYQAWMTRKRAKIIIAFTWLYGGVCGGLTNVKFDNIHEESISIKGMNCSMNNNHIYVYILFILHFLVPATVLGIVYIRIFMLSKRFARRIVDSSSYVIKENNNNNNNNNTIGQQSPISYCNGIVVQNSSRLIRQKSKSPNVSSARTDQAGQYSVQKMHSCKTITQYRKIILKASKTLAAVYGTFVTCWLPLCIFSIALNICRSCFQNVNISFYIICIEVLPMVNSILNVVIYAVMNSKFRKGFYTILRGKK